MCKTKTHQKSSKYFRRGISRSIRIKGSKAAPKRLYYQTICITCSLSCL